MKKKLLSGLIATACICGLVGCGKKKEDVSETATATDAQQITTELTTETASTEAEAEELKLIGEELKEGYSVLLTNRTGQDIVSVRIYDSVSGVFCDNMLPEDDIYAVDEQRIMYYEDKTEEAESGGADNEKLVSVGYDIELTLLDESVYVLHGFPFGDIKEGEIYVEEEVAFVVYDDYSTKEAELAIKEAQKPADSNPAKPQPEATQAQPEEPEPAPTQTEAAPAPVQTEAETTAPVVEEPVVEPEASEEPSVEQDVEECIGDEGLTY